MKRNTYIAMMAILFLFVVILVFLGAREVGRIEGYRSGCDSGYNKAVKDMNRIYKLQKATKDLDNQKFYE